MLTAQHYAIKMNSMYARVPGIAQQGVQPRAGSHFWDFHVITILGMGCLTSSVGLHEWILFLVFPRREQAMEPGPADLFQDVKKIGEDAMTPSGTELCFSSDHVSSSKQSKSCVCRLIID